MRLYNCKQFIAQNNYYDLINANKAWNERYNGPNYNESLISSCTNLKKKIPFYTFLSEVTVN